MSILSVKDLNKSYKKGFIPKRQHVLKGVSFNLESSSITGFLGGNGAGKTTTMKCLLELAFPDSGDIRFFDGQQMSPEVKKRIGFLPERPYFYEYLTGEEFLKFYANISKKEMSKSQISEKIDHLLKRVDLTHARNKKLRDYSKGMLQKIGLAQAIIHDPEFVILDEPMAGLDPDGRYYLSEIIKEVAASGTAVFFSSHLLHDVEKLCENLVVLKDGLVTFQGPTHEFVNKMGTKSVIHFFAENEKSEYLAKDPEDLQRKISELVGKGAHIVEVRPERNLEEAFVKWGLRGEGEL